MTKRREFLLQVLGQIQNHPANHHRDIMTFAAMCDDNELAQHVRTCANQIETRERSVIECR